MKKHMLLAVVVAFLQEFYLDGHRAWEEGDFLKARNAWYKFLEFGKNDEKIKTSWRYKEVQELFSAIEEAAEVPPSPVKVKAPVMKPAAPAVAPDPVLKQAGMAMQNGRYEEALKLYRIAAKIQPTTAEIQEKITQLEKELE